MTNYLTLEDAAKRLGLKPDEVVEMLQRNEIFGYRDGSSWKFKHEEIERVRMSFSGEILDEEAAGSSILVSENEVGPSGSKSGSTIGSDRGLGNNDSDLRLSDDGSDVALVPDPESGSGVRLVNRALPLAEDDDDVLQLADDDDDAIKIGSGSMAGSGISGFDLGSDLKIDLGSGSDPSKSPQLKSHHGSDVLAESDIKLSTGSKGGTGDIVRGDSDPAGSVAKQSSISDLEIATDDELVLGSGSDLAIASESGINLMSPSDSGLSLEDEPLDLAGTGISGLDLASDSDPMGSGASGSGSLVDFQQDEEFQLSPSGGIDVEEDSGSQVIELEDSSEIGDASVGFSSGDAGMMVDEFGMGMAGSGMGTESGVAPSTVMQGTPEVPLNLWEVSFLMITLLLLACGGIFVTDLVRNMWAFDSTSDFTTKFSEAFTSIVSN